MPTPKTITPITKPVSDLSSLPKPGDPIPQATPAKPKTSISTTLKGGGQECVVMASRIKDGWRLEVTIYNGPAKKGERREGKRGGTQVERTFDAISKVYEETIDALVGNGWARPEKKGVLGKERREDAFSLTNLPKPAKLAKK